MSNLKKYFIKEDLDRIEEAVQEAEKEVSGEIVTVFAEDSGNYEVAAWRASALIVIALGAIFYGIDAMIKWGTFILVTDTVLYSAILFFAGLISFFVVLWSGKLTRLFSGRNMMRENVKEQAENAFLEHQVFSTRQRTGILIYTSIKERRVQIIGDKGINEKIKPKQWKALVSAITALLKSGHNREAIITGVRLCKDLLLQSGFKVTDDDINELPNQLRDNE